MRAKPRNPRRAPSDPMDDVYSCAAGCNSAHSSLAESTAPNITKGLTLLAMQTRLAPPTSWYRSEPPRRGTHNSAPPSSQAWGARAHVRGVVLEIRAK